MTYLKSLTEKLGSRKLNKQDIQDFELGLLPDFITPPVNQPIMSGEAASPGAATGRIALSKEDVQTYKGEAILVKDETKAEDVPSIRRSNGLLAIKGGVSSHAAIITRGYGIPCITGCQNLRIIPDVGVFIEGTKFTVGQYISFRNGKVYPEGCKTNQGIIYQVINNPDTNASYQEFLQQVDMILGGRFTVKSNSDDPLSARIAKILGAKGIGVVRTEHMFFDTSDQERLHYMLRMLMANECEERESALKELYSMQVQDFEGIFREVKPYQVTIRLLDPPLHEFIPNSDKDLEALATKLRIPVEKIIERKGSLEQSDPMMGIRGVRLSVIYPEIYTMQVRAIFEAARSQNVKPEIMIPSVADPAELTYVDSEIITPLSKKFGIEYSLACMIETPRATEEQIAKKLAELANAFSFGTNDLTQYTFGMSRDLAGFLEIAEKVGTTPKGLFKTIDRAGVGSSIVRAVNSARVSNPGITIGVCGEHGGDPESIDFFINEAKVDYVSCSPFRVPIALLTAAYNFQ